MGGYWLIIAGNLRDENFQADYIKLWKPIAEKYKAKISVLKTEETLLETNGYARVIVVEFESYEVAVACYRDESYQAAKEFAIKASQRELLVLRGTSPRS